MSIYDIDFSTKAVELLPPDKRFPITIAWIKALVKQAQYIRDKYLGDYNIGANYPIWAIANNYNKGGRVIYKGSVYESLIDGNIGNQPIEGQYWTLYQKNFIGVSERVYYNGQKIVLEWALNKWFNTTFRQPPLVSDIFIGTNTPALTCFIVGASTDNITTNSSSIFSDRSSEYIQYTYNAPIFYNATINIPLAVYNALDTIAINREKIVRNFADLYFPAGITYNIATY